MPQGLCGNLRNKTLSVRDSECDELLPYRVGGVLKDIAGEVSSGYLSTAEIVQVCSAHIHNALVTSAGEVLCFGCGSNGRMGLQRYLTGLHGNSLGS